MTTSTPAANIDLDYDQVYRPQGSLFIELYNPSPPSEPRSGDLYTGPNGGINLAQIATSGTSTSPVWRMIITIPTGTAGSGTPNAQQPDPDEPNPASAMYLTPTNIERVVYFAPAANFNTYQTGIGQVTFCPSSAPAVAIVPGGYAVVGSGEQGTNKRIGVADATSTYIGFRIGALKGNSPPTPSRNIDLALPASPFLLQYNTNNPLDPPSTNVNAPATLAIDSIITGAGTTAPQRLSVSEPTAGYTSFETGGQSGASGMYAPAYDHPFDANRTDSDALFGTHTFFKYDGTIPAYRIIYLQRLANPLQPWSATNPYRTIDQHAIDVTAFNGVWDDTGVSQTPLDPDPQITPGLPPPLSGSYSPPPAFVLFQSSPYVPYFESRQRCDQNAPLGANNYNTNLWKQEPVAKAAGSFTAIPAVSGFYFNVALKHSLGYLNQRCGTPQDATNGAQYVGTPSAIGGTGPAEPSPWLNSNGRPYVNAMELMLVPTCSSSLLLGNGSTAYGASIYNTNFNVLGTGGLILGLGTSPTPYSTTTLAGATVPYPHLLNVFQSAATTSTGSAAQFHRILECLGVPSPFVGTDTWANPSPTTPYASVSPFLPPFDRISSYREPGRVNINTIYSQDVFNGLMAGAPDMATTAFWQKFVQCRRGDTNTSVLAMPATTAMPTEFGRPFRSFGGWSNTPAIGTLQPTREVECTLLRSDSSTGSDRPFFQFDSTLPGTIGCYNDPNGNPFFRYQAIQRLGNLVTTRSNVYAVWITVGYFEVTPVTTADTTRWPDGFQLGQELGSDTGEIERHRAFYIFDRTIPVGFQRGQDLNVEKAILVKRFIE